MSQVSQQDALAALALLCLPGNYDQQAHEALHRFLLQHPDAPPSRYPWDTAPEWAMWAATNENGERLWYLSEPYRRDTCWDYYGQARRMEDTGPDPDWRNSLEARPMK